MVLILRIKNILKFSFQVWPSSDFKLQAFMTKKMCFKTQEKIYNKAWPIQQEIYIGLINILQQVSTLLLL